MCSLCEDMRILDKIKRNFSNFTISKKVLYEESWKREYVFALDEACIRSFQFCIKLSVRHSLTTDKKALIFPTP